MSSGFLFDFTKVNSPNNKKQIEDERLNALLEENNLIRKKILEGSNSLMRAVSDAIFFTTRYHEKIQQLLKKHLQDLIASNALPYRLNEFQRNSILLNDYLNNPQLSGFEKVKVVVYSKSEDGYLNATIINNKYDKTIRLIRNPSHYFDTVYSKDFMQRAGVCQNVILNLVDHVVNDQSKLEFKDFNGDNFINYEYQNSLPTETLETSNDQFRITRGTHKKSFSDSFNMMSDQQMKFYDIFVSSKPPEDFLKLIQQRKDTMESNFSINANFDFMDEPCYTSSGTKENIIKKRRTSSFDISAFEQSPRIFPTDMMQAPQNNEKTSNKIFVDNTVNLNDGNNLDEIPLLKDETEDSLMPFMSLPPPHYVSSTITTAANSSQTYSQYSDALPNIFLNRRNMSNIDRTSTLQSLGAPFGFAGSPDREHKFYNQQFEQSRFGPGSSGFKKPFNNKFLTLSTRSNEFFGNHQLQGLENKNSTNGAQAGSPEWPEKKKPIILDNGEQRYTGRLKFFDEAKSYGFIIMDEDGSDIFVHYDDLMKANLNKDLLKKAKTGYVIRLSFSCMKYIGKYDRSRKAIDIQLIE